MKPYPFAGRGVLFNPDLPDGEMHMYGDFPLALFEDDGKQSLCQQFDHDVH